MVNSSRLQSGARFFFLDVYKELHPAFKNLLLVLVPRHAGQRSDQVFSAIAARELTVVRRTELKRGSSTPPDVIISQHDRRTAKLLRLRRRHLCRQELDRTRRTEYRRARAMRQTDRRGSQHGKFRRGGADFLSAGALLQVRDDADLRDTMRALLSDPAKRASLGEKAQRLVREKAGVFEKLST